MGNLIDRLYKWICGKTSGGRTWTSLIQKDQRKHPLLYILIALILGVVIGFCRRYWWQLLLMFGLGVVVGHLWW